MKPTVVGLIAANLFAGLFARLVISKKYLGELVVGIPTAIEYTFYNVADEPLYLQLMSDYSFLRIQFETEGIPAFIFDDVLDHCYVQPYPRPSDSTQEESVSLRTFVKPTKAGPFHDLPAKVFYTAKGEDRIAWSTLNGKMTILEEPSASQDDLTDRVHWKDLAWLSKPALFWSLAASSAIMPAFKYFRLYRLLTSNHS